MEMLGFTKREMPFRYLGIPLGTKILSVSQCQPLLEKMLGRITSWTTKFLSYAGRVQLLKNVLFSIQIYWSQIFVLPTKVIKLIEATCRWFLWTRGVELTKKSLLAWDKVFYPTSAGGLSILDIAVWKRATISKLLWYICYRKDKLWVKWVYNYYIKGEQVWGVVPKQASWVVQKIMKIQSYVQQDVISEEDL